MKISDFYPNDNCGTRIFAHGKAYQESKIDQNSGISTKYASGMDNYLTVNGLTAVKEGGSQTAHPFASLKTVYGTLGAKYDI